MNIAHRGGADLWPENTLEAFERAIAVGVDGIEFDLQLSADGHLVIHHDARLKAEATRYDGLFLEKPTPRIDAFIATSPPMRTMLPIFARSRKWIDAATMEASEDTASTPL